MRTFSRQKSRRKRVDCTVLLNLLVPSFSHTIVFSGQRGDLCTMIGMFTQSAQWSNTCKYSHVGFPTKMWPLLASVDWPSFLDVIVSMRQSLLIDYNGYATGAVEPHMQIFAGSIPDVDSTTTGVGWLTFFLWCNRVNEAISFNWLKWLRNRRSGAARANIEAQGSRRTLGVPRTQNSLRKDQNVELLFPWP